MILASAVASLSWESGLASAGLVLVLGSQALSWPVPPAGAGAGGRAGCGAEEDGRGPEGHSQVRAQDQGAELPGTAALDTAPAAPGTTLTAWPLVVANNPPTKPSPARACSGLCVGNDSSCASFSQSQHPLSALGLSAHFPAPPELGDGTQGGNQGLCHGAGGLVGAVCPGTTGTLR